MSTPLATLDGIAVGHDVVIMTGDNAQRWQVTADHGLVREGHRLEPFFLTGLLAANRIMDGDFSPPQVGEWFLRAGRYAMVLKIKDDNTTNVAIFRHGNFYQWNEVSRLVEVWQRVPAPEWAGSGTVLHEMTKLAWDQYLRAEGYRGVERKMRSARDYLRYVTEYTNTAVGLLTNDE